MRRILFPALAAALVALAAGCDIEFPEQEILARLDSAADRLDLLFIYKGVTAHDDSEEAVGKAVAAAERILAGRRQFMIVDWPLHFDLDREDCDVSSPLGRRVLGNFSVAQVGAFLDSDGRLSGYQLVRVKEAKLLFHAIDAFVNKAVLEADADGDLGDDAEFLDDRSKALMVERAGSGGSWGRLSSSGLEISFPVTSAAAAGAIRSLRKMNDDDAAGAALLGALRRLDVGRESTLARFGESAGRGTARFSFRRDDVEYSPALYDALRERGSLDMGAFPKEEEVRRLVLPR